MRYATPISENDVSVWIQSEFKWTLNHENKTTIFWNKLAVSDVPADGLAPFGLQKENEVQIMKKQWNFRDNHIYWVIGSVICGHSVGLSCKSCIRTWPAHEYWYKTVHIKVHNRMFCIRWIGPYQFYSSTQHSNQTLYIVQQLGNWLSQSGNFVTN